MRGGVVIHGVIGVDEGPAEDSEEVDSSEDGAYSTEEERKDGVEGALSGGEVFVLLQEGCGGSTGGRHNNGWY
jgi:hypothetical protein